MKHERALRAMEDVEDVFTPGGEPGVIAEMRLVRMGPDEDTALIVTRTGSAWHKVAELTAKEDL